MKPLGRDSSHRDRTRRCRRCCARDAGGDAFCARGRRGRSAQRAQGLAPNPDAAARWARGRRGERGGPAAGHALGGRAELWPKAAGFVCRRGLADAVGFVDDRFTLRANIKFTFQVVAALIAIEAGFRDRPVQRSCHGEDLRGARLDHVAHFARLDRRRHERHEPDRRARWAFDGTRRNHRRHTHDHLLAGGAVGWRR